MLALQALLETKPNGIQKLAAVSARLDTIVLSKQFTQFHAVLGIFVQKVVKSQLKSLWATIPQV